MRKKMMGGGMMQRPMYKDGSRIKKMGGGMMMQRPMMEKGNTNI